MWEYLRERLSVKKYLSYVVTSDDLEYSAQVVYSIFYDSFKVGFFLLVLTASVPIHCMEKITWDILLNIYIFVPQKKVINFHVLSKKHKTCREMQSV